MPSTGSTRDRCAAWLRRRMPWSTGSTAPDRPCRRRGGRQATPLRIAQDFRHRRTKRASANRRRGRPEIDGVVAVHVRNRGDGRGEHGPGRASDIEDEERIVGIALHQPQEHDGVILPRNEDQVAPAQAPLPGALHQGWSFWEDVHRPVCPRP